MYEDEYGIPLKLNHELKTMKEAENYFKRLEKYVGDYKLNYYISEIDEKEAEKTAKKMMKGNFDLEDFLNQLNQIKKLGPLENLLKLLPGAKKMGLNNVNIDPKIMKRTEAIVLSMTPEERRDPSILKASRKKRIADGSGTTVTDVNKLLNQFEEMKKMMKMM